MSSANNINIIMKICGVAIALTAIVVLFGWLIHNTVVVQIYSQLPPMQPNTALCFVLAGLGLLQLNNPNTLPLKIIAGSICAFAAIIGSQYVFNYNSGIDTLIIKPFMAAHTAHIGRMAPLAIIDFIFTALIFTILCWEKDTNAAWQINIVIVVLLSSLIISSALTSLLEFFTVIKYEKNFVINAFMAFQTAVCFGVLGLALITYAFHSAKSLTILFPIPIFIGLVASVLYVCHALKNFEDAKFTEKVRSDSQYAAEIFNQYQSSLYLSLNRIRQRWAVQSGIHQKWFESDGQTYIDDEPTLQGISIVDKNYRIIWITHYEKYKHLIGIKYDFEIERAKAIKLAIATQQAQTTNPINLLSNGQLGFAFMDPLYVNNKFDGFLIAGFSANVSFNTLFKNTLLKDYYLTVTENNIPIFNTLPSDYDLGASEWSQRATNTKNNKVWGFTLTPKPELLANRNSDIPLIILIAGLFTAIITALAIYFGLKSKQTTRALYLSEEKLRRNKDWLQAIMDASHHSIIATDLNGTIQLFNHAAERMLGYKAVDMIGKQTPTIIHNTQEVVQRAAELSKLLGREIKPGFETFIAKLATQEVDEREWQYVRRNKTTFPVWLSLTSLKVGDRTEGYVGIAQDISERKALEAMKNEFISIVSHELRTPLTSIQGSIALMLGGALGQVSEKGKKMLEIAHNNCERLIRLINDILDIEKIEAAKMDFNLVTLEINKLAEEVINANLAYAQKFQISLRLIPASKPVYVTGDSDRLQQVFTNLLSNAAKFSPTYDTVTIKITYANEKVCIAFIDKGPGIPDAFKKTIFQKFSQADSTTRRKQGGTGLGLSISKAIIEALGGTISFETELNVGTTFYVYLPARESEQ